MTESAVIELHPELPPEDVEQLQHFKLNKDTRFYEQCLPSINQLVMVKVLRVAETAAYVQLLEYSGIEGMILFSEVSTRRIRSMLKEIRAGQFAVCVVLRVEAERGYIDLSRRRVQAEDRASYLLTYAKSKLVQSTLRQLSAQHSLSMDSLCRKISWPLYKKYGHAIDAFKAFINSRDEKIFTPEHTPGIDMISDKIKNEMFGIIEKKLSPQATKLKSRIEVSCFEESGIEAVKSALLEGLKTNEELDKQLLEQEKVEAEKAKGAEGGGGDQKPKSEKELQKSKDDIFKKQMGRIEVKVVAPPYYDVSTHSIGKESGVQALDKALAVIEKKIKEYGGNFVVRSKPEVVLGGGNDEIIDKDLESGSEGGSDTDGDDDDDEEDEDETMGNFDAEKAFGK